MKQSRDGEVVCQATVLVTDFCAAGSTAQAYPKIDNTFKNEWSIRALESLIEHMFEPIRSHFGSLTISHGFTSLALINKVPRAVARGLDQDCSHELNTRESRICQHDGTSADVCVAGVASGELARYMHKYLPFDHMYVCGRDCSLHVSYSPQGPERQVVLMSASVGGKRIPRVVDSS